MRTTKAMLTNRFQQLAELLDWDIATKRWDDDKARIGSVSLEHNSVYGWNINKIVNEAGAESRIKESCSTAEMYEWLSGAVFAASCTKPNQ